MHKLDEPERISYSEKNGLPRFEVNHAKLREALQLEDAGNEDDSNNVDPIGGLWEPDTDADAVYKLIEQASHNGMIEGPPDRQIVIYPREVNDGCGHVTSVWSSHNNAFCQVVAETGDIKQLAPEELWEGDDAVERSVAVIDYIVNTINAVMPHLIGAEAEAAKVQRHYNEIKDGHGHWVLLNQLATDNNAKEGRTQLGREQWFATAEEAIVEVERLIAYFHNIYVTESIDADLPVDLNIEHFIGATSRLEAFRRSEIDEWSLFDDDEAMTLKFVWPELDNPF